MPTQRLVSKQSHCCSRDIHFTSNNTARGVNSILFSHKIGLNQDTGESLSVLWSDFMWDFNSLLEMKVASHRKHSKDPHDLWCIMTPCFVGNPFPHSKHWFENCWPQLCSWTWCKQKIIVHYYKVYLEIRLASKNLSTLETIIAYWLARRLFHLKSRLAFYWIMY